MAPMAIAEGRLTTKLVDVVGDRTAKVLDTVFGYRTVSDLLHHYPRRYLVRGELSDIAELNEGDEVTVLAEVFSSSSRKLHGRKGSILEVIVPKGYFLPVTPGTKFISIGGAFASDIHGKNHHIEGVFSDHVTEIKLINQDAEIVQLSDCRVMLRGALVRSRGISRYQACQ